MKVLVKKRFMGPVNSARDLLEKTETCFLKKKKTQNADVETQTQYPNGYLAYFLPAYFTIQLIFATIHESHCTFWYYSWISLYYFN